MCFKFVFSITEKTSEHSSAAVFRNQIVSVIMEFKSRYVSYASEVAPLIIYWKPYLLI